MPFGIAWSVALPPTGLVSGCLGDTVIRAVGGTRRPSSVIWRPTGQVYDRVRAHQLALTTRFTVREAETTGFAVNRLDWMTKNSSSPVADKEDRPKDWWRLQQHVNLNDLPENPRSER